MATRELAREDLRDRLHGCWLGQQIGATLGTPLDGRTVPAMLRFYDPVPGQASASQDIDFQLAWLDLIRKKGPDVTSDDLAEQWQDHVAYSFDELGWAAWNLRRGLRPPLSGDFNNWFKNSSAGMGRCLMWAMAAPGAPQLAVELAWQDAILDHASEGLWAAMFWAAVASAAFVVPEPADLLEIGLAMIPQSCRTAGAVRAARDRYRIAQGFLQIREAILNASGTDNVTDAAQNSGLVAMALLLGKGDFGATVTTAVNAGLNARVNGTLAGGIAGILRGRTLLPKEWTDPIGDIVIYGWGLHDLEVDRTTTELAGHTLEAAEAMLSTRSMDVAVVDVPAAPAPAPVPASAPPAAVPTPVDSEESELVGDRARFLEIEPAPAVSSSPPPTSEHPAPPETAQPATPAEDEEEEPTIKDVASQMAERESPLAPPEERAEISDTAMVAAEPPAAAGDAAVPPSDQAPAAESPSADEPSVAAEPAVAPAAPSAPTDPLADIFQPGTPAPPTPSEPPLAAVLRANERAKELLVRPTTTAVCQEGDFEFTVDYGQNGPVLLPAVATNFTVAVKNLGEADFVGTITLGTPPGWQVAVPGAQAQRQMIASGRMARFGFVLRAPEQAALTGANTVQVVLTPNNEPPVACDVTFLGGSCWWLTGPFANQGEEGYDRVFEVEDNPGLENQYLGRGGGMVGWQRMAFRESVIDLEGFLGGFGGVAYAMTTLHFPVQTDARLVIHSNDGVHAWVNNQRVLRHHSHEPFRPTVSQSRDMVDVTFKPGANKVMLKIVRCREPLKFAFVVTDRNGVPLDDVGNTKWETA